ncbi:MAG: fasciclin domain-containing protein [Cyanobacteria bacterium J06635_10]
MGTLDAPFAKLLKETLDKLLKPENKTALQQILTYHVVSGTVDSQNLKSSKVKTVEGNPVHVVVNQQNGIKINKSRVIQPDIKASNGIIHVIDTVLIPPGF